MTQKAFLLIRKWKRYFSLEINKNFCVLYTGAYLLKKTFKYNRLMCNKKLVRTLCGHILLKVRNQSMYLYSKITVKFRLGLIPNQMNMILFQFEIGATSF